MTLEHARYLRSLLPGNLRRQAAALCQQESAFERGGGRIGNVGNVHWERFVMGPWYVGGNVVCHADAPGIENVIDSFGMESLDHLCQNCGHSTRIMPFGRVCPACRTVETYRTRMLCVRCGKELTSVQAASRRGYAPRFRRRYGRWPRGPFCCRSCEVKSR